MEGIKSQLLPFKRITEGVYHNFFGYYDLQPWNRDGSCHLCTRTKFFDRMPKELDVAELGFIRMSDNQFIPIAQTSAWNFQQGAMLQWNPANPDNEVIYNIRVGNEFKGVIKNIHTGMEKMLAHPVASVDPYGRYALSINFSRMFDFRPGYGYAGIEDVYKSELHPNEDGVFLIDLKTGESKLIISLYDIYKQHENIVGMMNKKLLVNHITFNTDGSRFLFLSRSFPKDGSGWGTAIFSANTDGSGLYCLNDYSVISHYCWQDTSHILIYADIGSKGELELYLLKDLANHAEIVDRGFFQSDGHCSYSPDKRKILYDSYPDADGFKHLYLYDVKKGRGITLASLYSPPVSNVDIRCDLHPRWNRTGNAISFDSTHEGHRHVYIMELDSVDNYIK